MHRLPERGARVPAQASILCYLKPQFGGHHDKMLRPALLEYIHEIMYEAHVRV